jgi:hypothetical protein
MNEETTDILRRFWPNLVARAPLFEKGSRQTSSGAYPYILSEFGTNAASFLSSGPTLYLYPTPISSLNTDLRRSTDMADPTREEFDAKLEAVEARAESRFMELSGKIDRLADSVTLLTGGLTMQTADIRREVRSENNFTRWTIVIAVVTSLIGAVAALWVTQGNLLSAFSAGLTLRPEISAPPFQPKH